jgi:hypothetical protein
MDGSGKALATQTPSSFASSRRQRLLAMFPICRAKRGAAARSNRAEPGAEAGALAEGQWLCPA